MHIESVAIDGFRCFSSFSLLFDREITTFVGENGTGKSSVGLALENLIRQTKTNDEQFVVNDFRAEDSPVSIEVAIRLEGAELNQLLVIPLLSRIDAGERAVRARRLLESQGDLINMAFARPSPVSRPVIRWGQFFISPRTIATAASALESSSRRAWPPLVDGQLSLGRDAYDMSPPDDVYTRLVDRLASRFKRVADFRTRDQSGQRAGALESLTGSDLADVLLTLRTHPEPEMRARYDKIVASFQNMFPRYQLTAVELPPGSGRPEIQFRELGRSWPIYLAQISAGTHQYLSLLTMLIARNDLFIFIEHPEEHLHPHGMRALRQLIVEAANVNQIVVVTHSAYFVDGSQPANLRRFWLMPNGTVRVNQASQAMQPKELAQIKTVLRTITNREMVFARAVILVEDESQQEFVLAIAGVLEMSLDEANVSVISVGGQDGFQPFFVFLGSLGVPYIALRDLDWGDGERYPIDRFFSLGMELEDYVDQNGLQEKRLQIAREVGNSKRRVAGILGSSLNPEEVPALFSTILDQAMGFPRT